MKRQQSKLVKPILIGAMALSMTACGGGDGETANSKNTEANAVAYAGPDQFVMQSQMVMLDGSGSSDPDGDSLTYQWTQIEGPDVTNGAIILTGSSPEFTAPDTAGKVSFELRVNDGNGDSSPDVVDINILANEVSNVNVNPANQLSTNQAVPITQAFLEKRFNEAFTRILNSEGDSLALSIEGEITVPLPIPYVPLGLFNGGITVAKSLEASVSVEEGQTFYDITLQRDEGISMGVGVPGLPAEVEISGDQTITYTTAEVFRFSSPTDAARGMMNYFILKGLWQELNKLRTIGIDVTDIEGVIIQVRAYISEQTGFDFNLTITRDQLNALLTAARLSVEAGQIAVNTAQVAITAANSSLSTAQAAATEAQGAVTAQQRVVNRLQAAYDADNCTWYTCPYRHSELVAAQTLLATLRTTLAGANETLRLARIAANDAEADLATAQADLEAARQDVINYQDQLASLPESHSIDVLGIVLSQLVEDITYLNQHHNGSVAAIERSIAFSAEVDSLAGIGASRGRNFSLDYNLPAGRVAVTLHFSSEQEVEANITGLLPGQSLGLKRENGIEYTLVFVRDAATGLYLLQDKGTFSLYADFSGSLSGNLDVFHKVAGVGIKPVIEFTPGQEMTEFGENASGVIDISPIVTLVSSFPVVDSMALRDAVTTTIGSFNIDALFNAIQAHTLPIKIELYRISGFESEISGGNSSIMTGALNTSAIWTNYAQPLDYSNMSMADFFDSIFGGDGLLANLENLVEEVKQSYQDMESIN